MNQLLEKQRMKWGRSLVAALCVLFCDSLGLSAAERHPNVLLIFIDDLRGDHAVQSLPYVKTPNLDAFAATSRVFTHQFAQVPTCGASRCAILRGRYPTVNAQCTNKAIIRTHKEWGPNSLPAWFRKEGYQTYALGKVTHYPGGRTGELWAKGPEELPNAWDRCWIPKTPWGEPERIMHGYANGQPRQSGITPPWEAFDGDDHAYPDAWVADEAIDTLRTLSEQKQPWLFSVGFFKPHLPFAAPRRWYDLHNPESIPVLSKVVSAKPEWPSGWHASGEFRGNYGHNGDDPSESPENALRLRQAYEACVSYSDAQIGRVLKSVRELGLLDDTIVVVWGDHGFLLGEHAIWGKHCLYEHALRSPLIIRVPGMASPGAKSKAIVEAVDLFPTLLELCGLSSPENLDGKSLCPNLKDPTTPTQKPAIGFTSSGLRTIRTDRWRLIVPETSNGPAEWVELFDYETDPDETRNHQADHADVVRDLISRLPERPVGSVEKE